MGSTRVTDEKLQIVLANMSPITLPSQAYGPKPIEWTRPGVPVWAWVSWPHAPAERIAARAVGWNDRVVMVLWEGIRGEVNTVVWRNAVSRRTGDDGGAPNDQVGGGHSGRSGGAEGLTRSSTPRTVPVGTMVVE